MTWRQDPGTDRKAKGGESPPGKEGELARPNHSFEKRRRELEKKRKQEEKRQKKLDKKKPRDETDAAPRDGTAE